jgi:sugar phosphate isomerase/epimerase
MHARISVNSSCFPGAGWPELAGAFEQLGVQRISFVSTLADDGPAAARAWLQAGGYLLETIVHGFLSGANLDAGEATITKARETLSSLIELAAALGGRSIYMGAGGAGTLTWEQAAERFGAAIAPCVAQARAAGVALMIENTPPLYADFNIANSLRDAVTLAEAADVGVCLDVFGCWTEAGLRETIERAMPRCHLIQVSDYIYGDRSLPGRAVPGDGAIPLRRMLEWALSAGYAGAFELELTGPRIAQEGRVAAVRRGAERLDEMLRSLGA